MILKNGKIQELEKFINIHALLFSISQQYQNLPEKIINKSFSIINGIDDFPKTKVTPYSARKFPSVKNLAESKQFSSKLYKNLKISI